MLILLALIAGACTNGGKEAKKPPAQSESLKKLWEVPSSVTGYVGGASNATPTGPGLWTGDDVVAVLSGQNGDALTGFSTRTGRQRWKMEFPAGSYRVCALSHEVNADGIGGVVLRTPEGCTMVAAVSLADGSVLWHATANPRGAVDARVSVGAEALTASFRCVGVRRFALSDGAELPSPLKGGKRCPTEVDHRGGLLAVRRQAGEASSADSSGAAGKPIPKGEAAFELYDTDSGERLWQRLVDPGESRLYGMLAEEPVTLDLEEGGRRMVRTFDSDGEPGHTFDKVPDTATGMRVLGVDDEVLVGSDSGGDSATAYDLRAGKRLWTRDKDDFKPFGIRREGVLARQDRGEALAHEVWFAQHDLRDPDRKQTLGRLPRHKDMIAQIIVVGWDDERLYVQRATGDGTSVVAYALPERGADALD